MHMVEDINIASKDTSASFTCNLGLNLISLKLGDIEVIHSAPEGFIGPHFGLRHPSLLGGGEDPYPFGAARYLPWEAEKKSENEFHAKISGDQESLEGQKFQIAVDGKIIDDTLRLHQSVVSAADSLIGCQARLRLPKEGENTLRIDSRDKYYVNGKLTQMPEFWERSPDGFVTVSLNTPFEAGFRPIINPLRGRIQLKTDSYLVELEYTSISEESSWYIIYPEESPYISIAAVSSQNPWHPNLTVSSVDMSLKIFRNC